MKLTVTHQEVKEMYQNSGINQNFDLVILQDNYERINAEALKKFDLRLIPIIVNIAAAKNNGCGPFVNNNPPWGFNKIAAIKTLREAFRNLNVPTQPSTLGLAESKDFVESIYNAL